MHLLIRIDRTDLLPYRLTNRMVDQRVESVFQLHVDYRLPIHEREQHRAHRSMVSNSAAVYHQFHAIYRQLSVILYAIIFDENTIRLLLTMFGDKIGPKIRNGLMTIRSNCGLFVCINCHTNFSAQIFERVYVANVSSFSSTQFVSLMMWFGWFCKYFMSAKWKFVNKLV